MGVSNLAIRLRQAAIDVFRQDLTYRPIDWRLLLVVNRRILQLASAAGAGQAERGGEGKPRKSHPVAPAMATRPTTPMAQE